MGSFIFFIVTLASFWISHAECVDESKFTISVVTDGHYSLLVNDVPWLKNGDTFFNSGGRKYSTADESLKLINTSATSGYDKIGQWQSTDFWYQAGSLPVVAKIKTYTEPNLNLVIFIQKYMDKADQTSAGHRDKVIGSYPSFKLEPEGANLGYLAYANDMAGYNGLSFGKWDMEAQIPTGIQGGPLVLFDNSSNAMVISPMSQFMAASNYLDPEREMEWGVMGLVDTVPKDYEISFIVYFSDQGVNEAMSQWGKFLQKYYGKTSERRDTDLTVNYLGYWTDNGAYYYYQTEKGKNYEDTMVDTVQYIKQTGIPFNYMQYDSWWYAKGHRGGVLTWEPTKDVFPNGFQKLNEKTKLPFGLHNRYWDSQTPLALYNGGRYMFIKDELFGLAVPDDPRLFLDLFNRTVEWGDFILYEQDWMNTETDLNLALTSDLSLGRRWLVQMGLAAAHYSKINIQYCMAYSRHILQSLEIPVVTQARVSEDYSPDGKQWDIGVTSMFADAVNLAPFKDTMWTTENQPGNPYGRHEKHTKLQNIISTLSTGPVGPGDGIGFINKDLLMRCCNSRGLILKPSKPATAIDDQIKKKAFGSHPGPDGEVWTTFTNISGYMFGIVLAAELKNQYAISPSSGWTQVKLPPSQIYSGVDPSPTSVTFSDSEPLLLTQKCTTEEPCLYYTSPVFQLGESGDKVVLLGEMDKWVPMSAKRFHNVQDNGNDITVTLAVNEFETVTFGFQSNGLPAEKIVCDNSKSGKPSVYSTISIAKKSCTLQV